MKKMTKNMIIGGMMAGMFGAGAFTMNKVNNNKKMKQYLSLINDEYKDN